MPGEPDYVPVTSTKPRIVNLPPTYAIDFVADVHRTLPVANYRGLMYSLGVVYQGELVAVALANTPSGHHVRPDCNVDGVLELSRVASDGTLRGASSMLAGRMIDLLPRSGRFGTSGCLFVTYSLAGEAGHTYLALVDKGLRPTERIRGKAPSGARRKGGTTALPQVAKIVWEAGSAARPARWELLADVVTPERLAGARKNFEAWEQRQRT
jgi:predicted RecA/RadA family phage recombinase